MPRRCAALLVVASLAVGCGAPAASVTAPPPSSSGPGASTAPSAPPTLAPATHGPSGEPVPTVDVEPAIPPLAGTPPRPGAVGLEWVRANRADGATRVIALGPAGWLSILQSDAGGETPLAAPRVSEDLRSWSMLTPTDSAIRCGTDPSLAASIEAYVLVCQGTRVSRDGRSWTEVDAGDIRQVASDGRSFVGWNGFVASDAISVSVDGRTWERLTLPGAPALLVDIVVGRSDGGYLAAGRVAPSASAFESENPGIEWVPYPGEQALWTSPDGVTWERIAFGPDWDAMRITSIAVGGPGGGILASGIRGPSDGVADVDPIVGIWRSVDLRRWTMLEGPSFGLFEEARGETTVLATAERWIVIGRRLSSDAGDLWALSTFGTVAGSENGLAWWGIAPTSLRAGTYSVQRPVSVAGRVIAIVSISTGIDSEVTEIWASPD